MEVAPTKRSKTRAEGTRAWPAIRKDWDLYIMLVPGLLFLLLFNYTPMYGLIIAFQDFSIFKGITGSDWVGLKHFERLMVNEQFFNVLRNTIIISVMKLIVLFPAPIFLAVLLLR